MCSIVNNIRSITSYLSKTQEALGFDTKYFPYIRISSHNSVLLSQRPFSDIRLTVGGDEMSKEQSLPPKPLTHVHSPEVIKF